MKASRHKMLGISLLVTVGLTGWTAWRDKEQGKPIAEAMTWQRASEGGLRQASYPPSGIRSMPASGDAMDSKEWMRDPLVATDADPFKPVSFLPPPPKVIEAVPTSTPKPVAPPLPYRYFGRMADVEGKVLTYLTRDREMIPIQENQVLDNVYHIDSVTDSQIVMTYIPLDEKSVITIQSAAN